MSNIGPLPGQSQGRLQARLPTPPKGEPIARYDTYYEAQRAVDFLSDNHFPVQFVTIVGTGLQMVERVTGRLTYPRVAFAGALSGAYFGLFVGVLLFSFGTKDGVLLAAPLIGAAFGIMFGVLSYSLTGGQRDFRSTSQIVAGEYAVLCLAEQAGAARQLLQRLPGGTGKSEAGTGTSATSGGLPPYGSAGPGPYGAGPYGSGSYGSGSYGSGSYGSGPTVPGVAPPSASGPTAPVPSPSAGQSGTPGTSAPDEPGLTYGEAIERQRRERQELERQELERQRREREERERLERERLERERASGPTVAAPSGSGPTVAAPSGSGPTVAAPSGSGPTVAAPSGSGPTVAAPPDSGPAVRRDEREKHEERDEHGAGPEQRVDSEDRG